MIPESVMGCLILGGIDIVLYAAGRGIASTPRARSVSGMPFTLVSLACLAAGGAHFTGTWIVRDLIASPAVLLVASGLFAMPLFVTYGNLFTQSFATRAAGFLYGTTAEAKDTLDLRKAHERMKEGDLAGSAAEYRLAALAFPDSADPLFGLAAVQEQMGLYPEAVQTYREIARKFQWDDVVWIHASKNLAEVLRHQMEDPEAAEFILRTVRERNPDGRYNYTFTEPARLGAKGSAGSKRGGKKAMGKGIEAISDLDQARRLSKIGETDKAVALYRRYAREHAGETRPLFEAATALELAQRYDEAVGLLQDIAGRFRAKDEAWGEAQLRLAALYQSHLRDAEAARYMLKQILERMPRSKQGRDASARLRMLNN